MSIYVCIVQYKVVVNIAHNARRCIILMLMVMFLSFNIRETFFDKMINNKNPLIDAIENKIVSIVTDAMVYFS